jgi:glycosyltransferase involved in cell wall biosynthesis
LKLIYLHQYFIFPDSDGGTRSYDLATSFIQNGIEVEVVTSSGMMQNLSFSEGWNLIQQDGIKVHVLKLHYDNNFGVLKRIYIFLKFLILSTFKLLSLKADLVLATSTPLTIGVPALIKKWVHKTEFVFEVRDVWPETVIAIGVIKNKTLQMILYKLEKIIYKNATAIVPLSIDMKQSIVSRYNFLDDQKITVIENIAEIQRFKIVKPAESFLERKIGFIPEFTILYAGTFGKVNGLKYVVELAEKTYGYNKNIAFVLIGKGAEKQEVIAYSKKLNVLKKNLFILDPIPKNQLPLWYSAVDMGSSFVIDVKELWHNSANKYFDTLAAGKPILINYDGWQGRQISKENIGLSLPPNNIEKAAKLLVRYVEDNQKVVHGNNAFMVAKKSYSLKVTVNKYLSTLKSIVK